MAERGYSFRDGIKIRPPVLSPQRLIWNGRSIMTPNVQNQPGGAFLRAVNSHWREYLIEAVALGALMVSACTFAVLLEHPASLIHQALLDDPIFRRVLMGLAMGGTAIGIITSPFGQRSGAHMNPAVTLTFLSLKKVKPWDAFFYIVFQFLGGISGVALAGAVFGSALRHSSVDYIATKPGLYGPGVAFAAEFAISFLMMTTILWVSNSARLSRYTPYFAGALVALFITFEAPLSGMSMNPARTLGSAFPAGAWTHLWIYFTAPTTAMLLVPVLYRLKRGGHRVFCAKLDHVNNQPCIFNCNYGELNAR